MESRALAAAFDMEGAFNNVVLTLMRGASEPEVIARLDRLLEPDYGGLGAIPRSLQTSHWYLSNELAQLRTSGALRAGDLPRRRGVPAERGALAPRPGPAGADCGPQGARLRQRRHRLALREMEHRRGLGRSRDRHSPSGSGSDGR